MRGYFGVGVFQPKFCENVGTLYRSAHIFGASFIYTIGRRYREQASDTTKAHKSIPFYHYVSMEDFLANIPRECRVVCVENSKNAWPIKNFVHPERAAYLIGSEDNGIPPKILEKYMNVILPGKMCMNLAVAGSLVMFDRFQKTNKDI